MEDFIGATRALTRVDFEKFFASPDLQRKLQEAMLRFPGGNVYEWMEENKMPWSFWAFIHRVILNRMSIKVTLNTGHEAFISPTTEQFFDDGVVFLQGSKQMEGLLCRYKDERISVAHVNRDVPDGDKITVDDLDFIELDENGKLPGGGERTYSFDEAESALRQLINLQPDDESAFQEYFDRFPWVFGLQYNKIQSHKKFNDENIPDFSAVNARNSLRDIIEIKPPGLTIFGKGNAPLAAFHSAVSQCERYIDFADSNRDYLKREKGLQFDAPSAILVAGWKLNNDCLREVRRKERLNPRIKIYTYNDIITSIKSMKAVISELQKRGQQDGADLPATAPELKPEGDEKPKPESGGRSQ